MRTSTALAGWGRKVISFGKKHKGKTFNEVYETDPGYIQWTLARMDTMDGDQADFGNYARTRQNLERATQSNMNDLA